MVSVARKPMFLDQLKDALIRTLKANGIAAKVQTKPVEGTKLYRVAIVSPQFKALKHSERQSLVWRIAERALNPDDQMRISMMLTLSEEEAKGK